MPDKEKKVFVLTHEHNDYDQHGEYFLAVFAEKPSVKALAEVLKGKAGDVSSFNVFEAVALIEHIRAGGGRRRDEDTWYNLNEETLL